jgi:hypothetical protein
MKHSRHSTKPNNGIRIDANKHSIMSGGIKNDAAFLIGGIDYMAKVPIKFIIRHEYAGPTTMEKAFQEVIEKKFRDEQKRLAEIKKAS